MSDASRPGGRQGSSNSENTSSECVQTPVGADNRFRRHRPPFRNAWSHDARISSTVTPSTPSTRLSTSRSAPGCYRHRKRLPSIFFAAKAHFRPLQRLDDFTSAFPIPQNPHPKTVKTRDFGPEVAFKGVVDRISNIRTHAARAPRRPDPGG